MPEFMMKMCVPVRVPTFCASLRNRKEHAHRTRATVYARILLGKFRGPRSKKSPAQNEMHMDMSQEPFVAGQRAYPDPTPALTPTVRTPQCGQTVWGKTAWLTDRVPKIGVVWVIIFLNKPGMQ